MMEHFFLEVLENNIDSETILSLFISTSNSWIKGVKLISFENDLLRFTYYEVNTKERNPKRRLVERITPIEFILEAKIEINLDKDIKQLNRDLYLDMIDPNILEDDSDLDDDNDLPLEFF